MSHSKVLIVSMFSTFYFGVHVARCQEEQRDSETILQLYLTELDHSYLKFMRLLAERPAEARSAIESRLGALEKGTDPFSHWRTDPDENRRDRATTGFVLNALGRLSTFLGDEDYAHSVWRRAMILVLSEDLGGIPEAEVAGGFIDCARADDRDLLEQIIDRRTEFPPGVIMKAERSLERVPEAISDRESSDQEAAESRVESEAPSVSGVESNPWFIVIMAAAGLTSVVFVVRAVRGRRPG